MKRFLSNNVSERETENKEITTFYIVRRRSRRRVFFFYTAFFFVLLFMIKSCEYVLFFLSLQNRLIDHSRKFPAKGKHARRKRKEKKAVDEEEESETIINVNTFETRVWGLGGGGERKWILGFHQLYSSIFNYSWSKKRGARGKKKIPSVWCGGGGLAEMREREQERGEWRITLLRLRQSLIGWSERNSMFFAGVLLINFLLGEMCNYRIDRICVCAEWREENC